MKTIILILVLILAMGATFATAGEQLDLSVPISISAYRVIGLNLDWEGATITIFLQSVTTGQKTVYLYQGAEATQLMTGLNKADLTTNSLHKRVLEKLVADGKLTGTVSGSPD